MDNVNFAAKVISGVDFIPEWGDSNDYWCRVLIHLDGEEAMFECVLEYDKYIDKAIEFINRFVGTTVAKLMANSTFAFTIIRPSVDITDDECPF